MKKTFGLWILVLGIVAVSACAEKAVRVVIDPPPSAPVDGEGAKILYQTTDSVGGKNETVSIPVGQIPQRLVIENAQKDATTPSAMATIADKNFAQSPEKQSPKISYLKGVESVERLFNQKKYADALIQIAPLLSEYPNQTKLWIMQGTLYKKIGEKRLAYQAFKKAGTLDPNNVQVQRASDLLQSEIGEVAE